MTPQEEAEWQRRRREEQAFAATEIGGLFRRFVSAHARAWVTDSTSNSDRRMKTDWERCEALQAEFVAKLKELMGFRFEEPPS